MRERWWQLNGSKIDKTTFRDNPLCPLKIFTERILWKGNACFGWPHICFADDSRGGFNNSYPGSIARLVLPIDTQIKRKDFCERFPLVGIDRPLYRKRACLHKMLVGLPIIYFSYVQNSDMTFLKQVPPCVYFYEVFFPCERVCHRQFVCFILNSSKRSTLMWTGPRRGEQHSYRLAKQIKH